MHHSFNAADCNNISSKFQLQLKISKKNIQLENCHGIWDKTMQSMFARSNGQDGQSDGAGRS
jgi:hypothetical protein